MPGADRPPPGMEWHCWVLGGDHPLPGDAASCSQHTAVGAHTWTLLQQTRGADNSMCQLF